MGLNRIRLGDYIEHSTANNKDLKYDTDLIAGVNSQGVFATPKGNTDGVDLKPYKIVENGAFVYNPTRLELGSIAYRTEGLCIVSHLYMIFYLNEEGKKIIDPIWLYIYLRRSEFCREVTFRNFGSQRPEFNFKDMSEISILLPDIETQQKYVNIYNAMVENQQSYERGLEDLKLTCDAYIEDLRRKNPCEPIGKYIAESYEKNKEKLYNSQDIKGISISKEFTETKADTNNLNTENYNIVRNNQFAFNPNTARMGEKFCIALHDEKNEIIVSAIYPVFYVVDETKLLPEYLMMFFKRSEFDRYVRYNSWGSARETFNFCDIKQVTIPVPYLEIQQDIVNIFKTYNTRKEINEKLKSQIKDICPILIKGSIEEGRKTKEA